MPATKRRRPTDANQLAKLIVDMATGETPKEDPPVEREKDPAAVALGRKGGKKGGTVRASKLSAKRKSQIARKAARSRWKGSA